MSDIANEDEYHHPAIESVHPTTEMDSPDETIRHIHFLISFFPLLFIIEWHFLLQKSPSKANAVKAPQLELTDGDFAVS